VFVGYSAIFGGLPSLVHLPLVLIAGIIGGGLWGMLPGALKAYTGAHEVISTIMLNFIAIRLIDWLIKSDNPMIMLDPAASTPRTPYIAPSAVLPGFQSISAVWIIAAGLLTVGFMLWQQREVLRTEIRAAIRPVVYGVLVIVGGFFIQWVSVRNNLHVGLVVMLLTVWFVDWFLERTTLGFELRTVGANPDAARYAGMSVRFNTILALTLSGALVGLAGTIQISGVQQYMEPLFFAGLGFDSIAVALLARNNPRNMIPAGILWGALLTGSGLMQERATISNDLVKIIQALIIMFIAADMIIRYLWRVPEEKASEKVALSKGWGG
jgi:general nucleoside transport system permease protein